MHKIIEIDLNDIPFFTKGHVSKKQNSFSRKLCENGRSWWANKHEDEFCGDENSIFSVDRNRVVS